MPSTGRSAGWLAGWRAAMKAGGEALRKRADRHATSTTYTTDLAGRVRARHREIEADECAAALRDVRPPAR